jgi:flagellin-like protein
MKMKGISPMLATILLVAFTVAIGGIISVWMSSFTRTTQTNVESAAVNQTKCAGTYIDILSVTGTGTGNSSVMLTNRGNIDITEIRCFTGKGETILGLSGSVSLTPGNSTIGTLQDFNSTNNGTIITCSGRCLSVGVTGECRQGQGCWTAS